MAEPAQQLKVIETYYNGHHFRSRIEARWAVFYDSIGVLWEYEREGYDLGGAWYLPDFWMPEQGCFIEIKGKKPNLEEEIKASVLAQNSRKLVHVFYGPLPTIEIYAGWKQDGSGRSGVYTFTPQITRESGLLWNWSIIHGRYEIGPFGVGYDSATDELVQAYHKARTARF